MSSSEKITSSKVGLIANIFLFIIKTYFGLLSGSLALLSDAVNSFTDILASIGIYLAVKEGEKKRDIDHPFGHYAAEPISAFVVSILAAILSFEIFRSAVESLLYQKPLNISIFTVAVVLLTIIIKFSLYLYFKNVNKKSPGQSVEAYMMDSMNDVITAIVVLIGVVGAYFGYEILDDVVAIAISIYILRNALHLGKKNIYFLMGGSPSNHIIEDIKKAVLKNKKVKQVQVNAHYFGDTLHVDLVINVDKKLTIVKAHEIAEEVKKDLESFEIISYIQVHVEPD